MALEGVGVGELNHMGLEPMRTRVQDGSLRKWTIDPIKMERDNVGRRWDEGRGDTIGCFRTSFVPQIDGEFAAPPCGKWTAGRGSTSIQHTALGPGWNEVNHLSA